VASDPRSDSAQSRRLRLPGQGQQDATRKTIGTLAVGSEGGCVPVVFQAALKSFSRQFRL